MQMWLRLLVSILSSYRFQIRIFLQLDHNDDEMKTQAGTIDNCADTYNIENQKLESGHMESGRHVA
jgi:hypothetical protein